MSLTIKRILYQKIDLDPFPISIYIIWRLLIFGYQIFLQPYFLSRPETQTLYQRLYLAWITLWDSGHYLTIALKGYQFPDQAFFPLWPLAIKAFSLTGLSVYKAAFLLSFIFSLTTFLLFYQLAVRLIGKARAREALIFFAVFPSTMFLLAAYTEGLFLTLTFSAFILLEKKFYLFSTLLAGLATLTRLSGLSLGAIFLLLNKPWPKKLLYFLMVFSGLLLYVLYLQATFGKPLYFLEAQKERCQIHHRCGLTFPLKPLASYALELFQGLENPGLSSNFLDGSSALIFLILLYPVYKNLGLRYFAYSLISWALPLFSGSLVGMVRYVLTIFPVFFVLPTIIRPKILFFCLCLALFLLQLRFVTLFTNYLWVA